MDMINVASATPYMLSFELQQCIKGICGLIIDGTSIVSMSIDGMIIVRTSIVRMIIVRMSIVRMSIARMSIDGMSNVRLRISELRVRKISYKQQKSPSVMYCL